MKRTHPLFLSVADVAALVRQQGLADTLAGLVHCLDDDFRRWPEFDKCPRVASHSPTGVIELMPIADARLHSFKFVNGHPGNVRLGLPTVMAFGALAEVNTGLPLLISELTLSTALRTAATSLLAARVLARPDSRLVGIVGTGEQARQQVRWLRRLWDGPLEFALWGRSPERADDAVRDLGREGIKASRAEQLEHMCRSSDIVITTTASRAPIVQSDWIRPGSHITAVGADAPGKQELATALVARADVIVADLTSQCIDHGEIATAIAAGQLAIGRVTELGNVLAGTSVGRTTPEQITIADLTGLAVQDIAIARSVLATVMAEAC